MGEISVMGPSCEELARRATSGEFENASLPMRLLIRFHMYMCCHCRTFSSQMKAIAEAARRRFAGAPDPARVEALKRRLVE
jgi:hypothetical protein